MNPAHWKTVEDILASALELPPERQAAYVEQCCADSPEIRKEVEELLEAYRAAEKCIEPRAGNFDLPEGWDEGFFEDSFLGTRVGTYKLVERIGDGGMGTVYRAERDDGQFAQVVAVKLVRAGLHDPELLKRLRSERQILALLEHPHIARLLDGGITAGGQPYIVMEYIEGARITDYCKSHNLNIRQRLALFRQICSAVHYAHQRLVVHRDIKPSNILVANDGVPKLLDFGIAKIVDSSATGSDGQTVTNFNPMTPEYASPEQIQGQALTAATDIYSLGVLLFELLTDQKPYPSVERTPREMARLVCEAEPQKPTAVIASVMKTQGRREPVSTDLDHIVMKAMRKEPGQRYGSAEDLSQDIGNHLAGFPVRAREGSFRHLAGKFVARHRVVVVLSSVLLLVLLAGTALVSWQAHAIRAQRGPRLQSLVVLPLQNLSGDLNQDYFAEGMTDELTTQLAKISSIRVISRISAMRYKDTQKPLSQIARELNVDAIVEGSVIRTGNAVRLTAQLIDPSTDQHLWAESYERGMQDIPSLQKDVALNIVGEIEAKLTPNERMSLTGAAPISPEVYEAYLKGRYYLNQATEEGLTNSLAYFQQAVERDPNYAPGYAGLADAYIRKVYIGTLPRMVLPKAKVAAQKALQLDDTLAEAHAALAYVKAVYDHDWRGAEPEFRRAIELNPGNALVHYYYAVGYLVPLGRHDEAIEEMKKAVWLDPLSPIVNVEMGVTLFYARKYDQAILELHETLDLDPNLIAAHWVLVNAYEQKAMYPEAVVEFQRLAAVMRFEPGFVASIHQAYVTAGVSGYWQKRLEVLKGLAKHGVVNFSEPAIVYSRLGEKEHALQSLEEGEGNPDARSIFLNVNPALDGLRTEPRFQDLVRRLNLPPTDTQRARR